MGGRRRRRKGREDVQHNYKAKNNPILDTEKL